MLSLHRREYILFASSCKHILDQPVEESFGHQLGDLVFDGF